MDHHQVSYMLVLLPFPSLFYLITVSFRLLPRKLLRKKQTFLGRTLFSSFCSSHHSYRERIGLLPSPLCSSCGLFPHTTVHVFSCSSHPTPLTELDLWECPRLALDFLSVLPFFDLPPFLPPPLESLHLVDKAVRANHHHESLSLVPPCQSL